LVVNAFCILAATLSNSALVRLLQESYVDAPEKVPTEMQVPLFALRVISMIASGSGLIFAVISIFLVGARFGTQAITFYVSFTFLLPQVVWFFYVIILDVMQTVTVKTFFRTLSMCFSLNVIIRCVFLITLLAGMDNEYKATVGDSDSIKSLLNLLNTEVTTPTIPSFVSY
jgi:hypothetical protein